MAKRALCGVISDRGETKRRFFAVLHMAGSSRRQMRRCGFFLFCPGTLCPVRQSDALFANETNCPRLPQRSRAFCRRILSPIASAATRIRCGSSFWHNPLWHGVCRWLSPLVGGAWAGTLERLARSARPRTAASRAQGAACCFLSWVCGHTEFPDQRRLASKVRTAWLSADGNHCRSAAALQKL